MVVKVEKIFNETPFNVMQVMTGGKVPEIRIKTDETGKETQDQEPVAHVKVSDTSQMAFELVVPESLMPRGVEVGNVIRVKSVVASTE